MVQVCIGKFELLANNRAHLWGNVIWRLHFRYQRFLLPGQPEFTF